MGFDQPTHWIVIAIVAALLFGGYKKLPEMARSAGKSMRIFKTELKGMESDDQARAAAATPPVPPPPPPAIAPVTTIDIEKPADTPATETVPPSADAPTRRVD